MGMKLTADDIIRSDNASPLLLFEQDTRRGDAPQVRRHLAPDIVRGI